MEQSVRFRHPPPPRCGLFPWRPFCATHGLVIVARASLVCTVLLAGCLRPSSPDPQRPAPTPATAAPVAAPAVAPPAPSLRFVVRVTGGAAEGARLPLVVALHGLGDSPEAFIGFVTEMGLRVRVAAPAGPDRWGDGYAWFASRAGTSPSAWAAGIRRAADALVPEIARVAAQHPTCGLPVVTGFSQGAMLSYAVIARPEARVFAALPIAGLLPRELWPEARPIGGLMPGVYAFHGAADARVALADDRATLEAFRAVGHPSDLREYPGVPHTIAREEAADVRARLAEMVRAQGCPAD